MKRRAELTQHITQMLEDIRIPTPVRKEDNRRSFLLEASRLRRKGNGLSDSRPKALPKRKWLPNKARLIPAWIASGLRGVRSLTPMIAIVFMVLILAWAITTLLPREQAEPASGTQNLLVIPTVEVENGGNNLVENAATPFLAPTRRSQTSSSALYYTVEAGDTLLAISEKTGVALEIIVALNDLENVHGLQPGMQILIGFKASTPTPGMAVEPTPVTPAPLQAPLSHSSTSGEIRNRLGESGKLWNTLWADAQITTTSKNETIVYREQIWLSPPDKSRYLTGELGGEPALVRVLDGSLSVWRNLQTGAESSDSGQAPLLPTDLRQVLFPGGFASRGGIFRPVDSQTVAGREALVVDWTGTDGRRTDRFWVDVFTGVVLRWQHLVREYPDSSGRVTPTEILITSIAYDVDFSMATFARDSLADARFEDGPQLDSR